MYSSLGNHCTNFIDDFGKAEIQEQSYDAFCAFGTLLAAPGLDSSPEKESPPATSMVFLGIFVHTENMTVSITPQLSPGTLSPLFIPVGWKSFLHWLAVLSLSYVLCQCMRYVHCTYTVF